MNNIKEVFNLAEAADGTDRVGWYADRAVCLVRRQQKAPRLHLSYAVLDSVGDVKHGRVTKGRSSCWYRVRSSTKIDTRFMLLELAVLHVLKRAGVVPWTTLLVETSVMGVLRSCFPR